MSFNNLNNGGFVKAIIIIVIVLIVLGYLGYNINDIIKHPIVQSNLNWAWNTTKTVWNKFLKAPATWVWNQSIGALKKALKNNDVPNVLDTVPR